MSTQQYVSGALLQQRDIQAQDQRQILTLALGSLPPDLDDREVTAVILAATGASRAEIGALMGYDCVDSVTRWRRERADVIRQAEDNLSALLKGIARLTMTNVLLTGLELGRRALRHAQTVSDEDAGDALVKLARAGRDITALAEWIDSHSGDSSRSGSPPAWGTPPRAIGNSLQASAQGLHDLVNTQDACHMSTSDSDKQPVAKQ